MWGEEICGLTRPNVPTVCEYLSPTTFKDIWWDARKLHNFFLWNISTGIAVQGRFDVQATTSADAFNEALGRVFRNEIEAAIFAEVGIVWMLHMGEFFPCLSPQIAMLFIAFLDAFGDDETLRLLYACEEFSIADQNRANVGSGRCRQKISVGERGE